MCNKFMLFVSFILGITVCFDNIFCNFDLICGHAIHLNYVNFILYRRVPKIINFSIFVRFKLSMLKDPANFDLCSHSWRSLAGPTFCETGHPFVTVISEEPGAVTTFFNDFCLSRLGFEHPTFRLQIKCFNALSQRRG